MKLLAISTVSWVAALATYIGSLRFFWDQRISAGDLRAVAFWSIASLVIAVTTLYAPVMSALQRRRANTGAWWLFPMVSIAIGIVPVLILVVVFQGDLTSLVSPEALLFYCMFSAFGAVFGTGFYLAYVRPPA